MQQYFIEETVNLNDQFFFNDEQSHHIKNVLRMKNDDIVKIVDINHNPYLVKLTIGNNVSGKVFESLEKYEEKVRVTLVAALIKNDKWDFMIQKVCELGVSEIVPLEAKRCVVRLKDKADKKIMRFNKIALEACEQCKREDLVTVNKAISLKEISAYKSELNIVAYEDADYKGLNLKEILKGKPKSVTIVIGPEGGFDPGEIEYLINNDFKCVSLGKRILRAETASIASVGNIMFYYE